MSILLDVGIGLEINVLTSKFILLGYQMLGEMGCHPEICFYRFLKHFLMTSENANWPKVEGLHI